MRFWIDGYNLIGQLNSIQLSDTQKEDKLLEWLDGTIQTNQKAVVVFDGQKHQAYQTQQSFGAITCIYTDPYESADDFLIKKMEQHKQDVWVSSDRNIKDKAKLNRCKCLACLEWINYILKSKQSGLRDEKSVNIGSIDDWLEIFE